MTIQYAILRSDGLYYCAGLKLTSWSSKTSDAQFYTMRESADARCSTLQWRDNQYKMKVVAMEVEAKPSDGKRRWSV